MATRSTLIRLAVACIPLSACSAEDPGGEGAAAGGQNGMQAIAGMGGLASAGGMPAVGGNPASGAPGTMPPGTMPPGTMPPGTMPPGTMPPDTMPPGTMPPMPPDTMPPDTMPPDTMPPDTMPPGNDPMTPGTGSADISSCTPPPEGSSDTAVRAWTILNEIRLASGSTCINMVPELNQAAQSHCDYRAMHRSNPACNTDAHSEVMGCAGFTGANVQAREVAAGYPRQLAYTEVALTYGDNPELAIPGWLVTPFHRIPMLDPWTTDMGWGGAAGCDIIDFGRGTEPAPDDTIVVYPHDGQIDVAPSFNGLEAPAPPPPPGGFPSSYPVSIYAKQMMITEHVLTKDGDPTPIEHLWLDARSPEVNVGLRAYFATTAMLYGAPFEANTTYRVRLTGTYVGGALDVEWTFTTGAARPRWF